VPDARAAEVQGIEPAAKGGKTREPPEREQVRSATTIGRPEPRDERSTPKRRGCLGPGALEARAVAGVPSTPDSHHLPEIVDMPVDAARRSQVMPEARTQTSGSEGAAEVQIER
jgi:hypothetical protein